MRSWSYLLSSLPFALALGCASLSNATGPESVSGTWRTEAPAAYIIEHSVHKPQGDPVEHDHIELRERSASIEWHLDERSDGLVTGTTNWIAYGPDGEKLFEGTEPLLGARDLGRLVIEEAVDDETNTPQMVFHCAFDGPDQIRVIGHEVGTKDLIAMRFVLRRE